MKQQKKILVIKLSALGDFIQAMGPMAAIRRHHPDAHITLLTTKMFKVFGEKCGYFNNIKIDERPKMLNPLGWLKLRKELIDGQFDRVYDLQNNDRTATYLKLFPRKNRPEWVGAAKGASHRNDSPERIAGHAFDGHKQTLNMVGIDDIEIDNLSWAKEDLSAFRLEEPYILFVAGCSPQHPQKRWPAEKYGELANLLNKEGFQIITVGTDAERDVTSKIEEICPQVLNITGQTSLFQIAALSHGAHAAIGNDTGPMHMAGPTGCPSLALFSNHSNTDRHAPKGKNVITLQKENICDITVEEVLKKIEELLSIHKNN